MSKDIKITLSCDEALVLYDWVAKLNDGGQIPSDFPAQILFDVEATLETQLSEVLSSDYENLVADAKQRLAG